MVFAPEWYDHTVALYGGVWFDGNYYWPLRWAFRIGELGLLALELQEPEPGVGAAGLRRPPVEFGDSRHVHDRASAKAVLRNQAALSVSALDCELDSFGQRALRPSRGEVRERIDGAAAIMARRFDRIGERVGGAHQGDCVGEVVVARPVAADGRAPECAIVF